MKKIIFFCSIFILHFVLSFAGEKFPVNVKNSSIFWEATKVTGAHHGLVNLKSGFLEFENDKLLSGEFVIDMNTIVNKDLESPKWNTKLVNHLKSEDFFSVEKFPEVRLLITSIKPGNDPDLYSITADAIIKGISKPVNFDARIYKNSSKAEASLVLDRTKWNIQYRSGSFFENLGDRLIYDDFTLNVKLFFEKGK